ncbi:LacI family DNA-binding transcriptional regulator [Alteromonas oceanisediminis]|uniref:LacI family DNA-binding transcriptional regulator n=1 Tax=Alteromonas oceanisediminis TaxID=2836180 RepID=UPI001BDB2562|nr:LacI family DNA-binding transcriptional regulator [Alteromonas oceanisediminis]MBT0587368.1 LacI family DNA-binding transcriptional regulator [Alteromonas oceanisediminis]
MNLKQVANALGVSTATISNAFNRPDQLSAKLRERILRDAAELGYHGPNLAARTLRRGESDVIGVMLSDSLSYSLSDPVASQLLQGVADVLVENNKHMLLLSSLVDTSEQLGAESLPDGFLLYGTIPQKILQRVMRNGKPVVIVDFESAETTSVNIDNEHGAYEIAKLALKGDKTETAILGLKLIDFNRVCRLTQADVDMEYQEISRSRLAGFMQAANERGVNIAADAIWHIPINNRHNAEIAAREALTKMPRPEVLLCMSDVIALSAIRVARDLGLRVPEDVAITGFDGIPEAEHSQPPLTTVCQQSIEKGKLAAQLLMEGAVNKQVVLETRIVQRGSLR